MIQYKMFEEQKKDFRYPLRAYTRHLVLEINLVKFAHTSPCSNILGIRISIPSYRVLELSLCKPDALW